MLRKAPIIDLIYCKVSKKMQNRSGYKGHYIVDIKKIQGSKY